MDVGLNRIGQVAPPHFATGAAGWLARRSLGAGGAAGLPADRSLGVGGKARAAGAAELAKVAGEEAVDERELRRDDALGNIAARAFDPATAAAAVRQLPIGAGE